MITTEQMVAEALNRAADAVYKLLDEHNGNRKLNDTICGFYNQDAEEFERLAKLISRGTGWLVEYPPAMGTPLWARVTENGMVLTSLADEALRFSREQDAEAFILLYAPTGRATEHAWS